MPFHVLGGKKGLYMKITICDDSIKDLLKIEKLLLKYKTMYPDREFAVEKFSDPSRLFQKL